MKVLVTGATGYVGSRLVPELLRRGHTVVGTHTSESPRATPWADEVQWRRMDVLDPHQAVATVRDVDAVVYLIHGMSDSDFSQTDREAAENVRAAVDRAGIARVVYLSGIIPDLPEAGLSEHLQSRLEVEQILAGASASCLSLRAAVVVGAASTSFEIIRQISHRIPLVQALPTWMRDTVVQPIAIADAVHFLAEGIERPDVVGHLDIAGPDRVTYAELLRLYAAAAGLTRVQVTVPGLPADLTGWLAGQLTDVSTATVESLMASLQHDMVADPQGSTALGSPVLIPLREALVRSLPAFDPDHDGAAVGGDPARPSMVDPEWTRRRGG